MRALQYAHAFEKKFEWQRVWAPVRDKSKDEKVHLPWNKKRRSIAGVSLIEGRWSGSG